MKPYPSETEQHAGSFPAAIPEDRQVTDGNHAPSGHHDSFITRYIFSQDHKTISKQFLITGNPNFIYELACDQLCGNAHYAMRATVVVETRAQFDQWISRQKSQYAIAMASETGTLKGATADAGIPRADSASSGKYEKQKN